MAKYKVAAGAEAATTTSTRCREKNCRGEGTERRDEGKEGEGRGEGETTLQSFSLTSTLRIPNLGHTDTNEISVPVGERRRRKGEKTNRGIRIGVVQKLRICKQREAVTVHAVVHKFGAITSKFVLYIIKNF